ncbi:MAG: efflux RND transporter periplasmic adaptor subunit [Candidatus Krumholzibacteria bacterium]|nr:efflux RND transporter periplasmic adaptor subunit [Candidatus Krumholzibacteria bacterium]MDP7021763.1 efflux RND transporter periplasmic adaptor subunit [Candidatus Krumholzibacteria bacterium]
MNRTLATFALLLPLLLFGSLSCGSSHTKEGDSDRRAGVAFCEEHQIAEAQCPYCDPSLVQILGFCKEHDVPEAFCHLCNPAMIPAFKSVGDWCEEHNRPESQCDLCGLSSDGDLPGPTDTGSTSEWEPASRSQQPPTVYCRTQDKLIRFDNAEIAKQAGLEFSSVESQSISKTLHCNAEVAYNENRYAQISAQVPGIVSEVHRNPGDTVKEGDALLSITSTHLGAAKAAYLQALASVALWQRNYSQVKKLLERGVSTAKELLEAETRLAESRIEQSQAEQTLLSYGLSSEAVETLPENSDTSARYTVTAPFAGVVVNRDATIGELVDPARSLFAIADLSRMWAFIDIHESDLREIREGQPVLLQVEGLPGEAFAGNIQWVSSQVNPGTRTLLARAEFDNSRRLLRANMFARARITLRHRESALLVPEDSVQWEGCCNIVFVRNSDTEFEPRKVHLGVATGNVYEVLSGVKEGEDVVTQGSFLLKTEILKGNIGAGCCEIDPGS